MSVKLAAVRVRVYPEVIRRSARAKWRLLALAGGVEV